MDESRRSVSLESIPTKSTTTHRLSSAAPTDSRELKGKAVEIGSNNANAEKANISSPSTPFWRTPIQQLQRRPSATSGYFSATGPAWVKSGLFSPAAENTALSSDNPTKLQPNRNIQRSSVSIPDGLPGTQRNSLLSESDRNKNSFPGSLFSLGSAIMSSSWGSSVSNNSVPLNRGDQGEYSTDPAPNSATISSNSASARNSTHSSSMGFNPPANGSEEKPVTSDSQNNVVQSSTPAPDSEGFRGQSGRTHQPSHQSRSKAPSSRRLSNVTAPGTATGSVSPGSDRSQAEGSLGVIGICALDAKARSKPARNILNRINSRNQFEVNIFGDKIILDEEPGNWPLCDYLISFFSAGFPLDKAIEYVRLRKPFTVNDLSMQTVLWDRRICLQILDKYQVRTPRRVEVCRDGGPVAHTPDIAQHIYERTGVRIQHDGVGSVGPTAPPKNVSMTDNDTLNVDGRELKKPFVEKPVSGEDHNIYIYYKGGGGRRLFRKVNNKSSDADESLMIPRCMNDRESSYIYESFLAAHNSEDIKAYTVGPDFCHAETRKSPVVDGIVKRNTHGKEVRYVTGLSPEEASMASRIAEAFGQRVCGFDLLRAGDKSYVIDVNGWSFVKDNNDYYDRCAHIMKEMFVKEKMRRDGNVNLLDGENGIDHGLPNRPSGAHFSSLKSILRSPSMSRLAGNHHHSSRMHNQANGSPDISTQTTPMVSSASIERSAETKVKSPKSAPANLPPPIVPVEEMPINATPAKKEDRPDPVPPPATKSQWKLKGMVAVIRHADRTPKQKFKFTFHTKPFVDLLKGHTEEVLLAGEAALDSVQDAVKAAMTEGVEDQVKLFQLQKALIKKGAMAGTKVQIKPMFRSKEKEDHKGESPMEKKEENARGDSPIAHPMGMHDDRTNGSTKRKASLTGVTLSRAAAAEGNLELEKLQLIVKWGGEPTHSARYQSQELGENMRNDLNLMNRDFLSDVKVFSSSERRVTTSAQIWTAAFKGVEDVPQDFVKIRKDLLDDSNAAKDEMDRVKKKLKGLLRKGQPAPAQFAWPENMPEPYLVARSVVESMTFHRKVMRENFARLQGDAKASLSALSKGGGGGSFPSASPGALTAKSIQARWCCGEDATLFKERWEKLFDEFCDPEKVDPSKISELHDTIKFDALHNRAFLEWVFTPSAAMLEEFYPSTSARPSTQNPVENDDLARKPPPRSNTRSSSTDKPSERQGLAHRMGFRKRSSIVDPATLRSSANDPATESYFNLYTSDRQAKAEMDVRLEKLRELFLYSKILFDFIGPQEYGITDSEKLEIGLLTSLPLLRAIVDDLEDMQSSEDAKTRVYFTKESHIYTLLNCIIEGGIKTKIERNKIPELDYLSTICFEIYESQNPPDEDKPKDESNNSTFNYSIRITISPGCHTFEPLDVQLDSKHTIGFSMRRSLTAHNDYKDVIDTLRAKFHTVKLPKSFTAVNLSEKVPYAFVRKPVDKDPEDATDPIKAEINKQDAVDSLSGLTSVEL